MFGWIKRLFKRKEPPPTVLPDWYKGYVTDVTKKRTSPYPNHFVSVASSYPTPAPSFTPPPQDTGVFGLGTVGDALILSELMTSSNHTKTDDAPAPASEQSADHSSSHADTSTTDSPASSSDSGSFDTGSSSFDSGSSSFDSGGSSFSSD